MLLQIENSLKLQNSFIRILMLNYLILMNFLFNDHNSNNLFIFHTNLFRKLPNFLQKHVINFSH